MKHRVAGRKLGRTSAHRRALLRNLSTALFDRERITTTLMKAKELRPFAERLVTLSKRETLHARRRVLRHIHDRKVVAKLFDILSARYAQRPGGYTRIIKLGTRRGDGAEMAIIELLDAEETLAKRKKKAAADAKAKAQKGERPTTGEAEEAAPEVKEKKAAPPAKKKAAKEEAKAGKPARKKAAAEGKTKERASKPALPRKKRSAKDSDES